MAHHASCCSWDAADRAIKLGKDNVLHVQELRRDAIDLLLEAAGDPMTRTIQELLAEVHKRWREERIQTESPATPANVRAFESTFTVQCPKDFATYLTTLGGMKSGTCDQHFDQVLAVGGDSAPRRQAELCGLLHVRRLLDMGTRVRCPMRIFEPLGRSARRWPDTSDDHGYVSRFLGVLS